MGGEVACLCFKLEIIEHSQASWWSQSHSQFHNWVWRVKKSGWFQFPPHITSMSLLWKTCEYLCLQNNLCCGKGTCWQFGIPNLMFLAWIPWIENYWHLTQHWQICSPCQHSQWLHIPAHVPSGSGNKPFLSTSCMGAKERHFIFEIPLLCLLACTACTCTHLTHTHMRHTHIDTPNSNSSLRLQFGVQVHFLIKDLNSKLFAPWSLMLRFSWLGQKVNHPMIN